jgi:drug/metabolite transporter (DMT)-like permease
MLVPIAAIFCVIGLALGQILFKVCATSLAETGSFLALKTASIFLVAMSLYATTTLVWIWVLQKVDLGRVYPLMALAFVLVPLGSYLVFGERFQTHYFIGVALIMVGIVVATRG